MNILLVPPCSAINTVGIWNVPERKRELFVCVWPLCNHMRLWSLVVSIWTVATIYIHLTSRVKTGPNKNVNGGSETYFDQFGVTIEIVGKSQELMANSENVILWLKIDKAIQYTWVQFWHCFPCERGWECSFRLPWMVGQTCTTTFKIYGKVVLFCSTTKSYSMLGSTI